MREIKFRAWSNRDKCWCGAFSVHKSGLFTEMTGARIENGVCTAYADWIDLSKQTEIVLMQYTGLKDKNGKEIYEGDVVKGAWNDDVYPVEFTFSWIHQYVEYGREPLEVIGNIYENPDLIKS